MKTSNYTMIKLEASDGCWLTESADVDISNRTLCKVAFTASTNVDDWKEITDAEYQILKEQQDKQIKENEDAINEQTESNI